MPSGMSSSKPKSDDIPIPNRIHFDDYRHKFEEYIANGYSLIRASNMAKEFWGGGEIYDDEEPYVSKKG
jgi:hypothetical protein